MPALLYNPQSDSACMKFFSHKICSIVVGIFHLGISISAVIGILTGSTELKGTAASKISGVIFSLLSVAFCILLLVGLHKNKKSYIQAYLTYFAVFIVLAVIGFFCALFRLVPSVAFSVSQAFMFILGVIFILLFMFTVHVYFFRTYCAAPRALPK